MHSLSAYGLSALHDEERDVEMWAGGGGGVALGTKDDFWKEKSEWKKRRTEKKWNLIAVNQ